MIHNMTILMRTEVDQYNSVLHFHFKYHFISNSVQIATQTDIGYEEMTGIHKSYILLTILPVLSSLLSYT